MKVLKVTHEGKTYYITASDCALPVGSEAEVLDMTEAEYFSITATHEAYVFVQEMSK